MPTPMSTGPEGAPQLVGPATAERTAAPGEPLPTEPHTHPLAILNTAIATAPGDYEIRALPLCEARALVIAAPSILSAVGHQATAQVLTELLRREIPVNRIQFAQASGQSALVLKLRGRIPEGVVLDVASMEQIGYDLWLMTRRPRSLAEWRDDLDRCEHGRHSRAGRGQPDPCCDCPGGLSAGNPVSANAVIGYRVGGQEITLGDLVASPDALDPELIEALRIAELIKTDLAQGRGADDPVTAGEVAERLPERLRSPYWRHQLDRFFTAEDAS